MKCDITIENIIDVGTEVFYFRNHRIEKAPIHAIHIEIVADKQLVSYWIKKEHESWKEDTIFETKQEILQYIEKAVKELEKI